MPPAATPPFLADLIDALVTEANAVERGRVLSGINEDDLDAIIAAAQRMKSRSRPRKEPDEDDGDDENDSPEEGAESATVPSPSPARITTAEAATLASWLEARLHSSFTLMADDLYGAGMLSREERGALSAAVGAGLDAFTTQLQSAFPEAFSRAPDAGPEGGGVPIGATEATKTEDGTAYPASDFAYVPDPEAPSTWKLRLTSTPGGAPDARIVGAAAAALGPGFRGQRVQIPAADLPRVKAKVRAAWRKANPDKNDDEMPSGIKEAEFRPLMDDEIPMIEEATRDLMEAGRAELLIIKPGWGSSGYYPAEVLKRDGPKVFKAGTHMYWNHPTVSERRERPERDVHEIAATLAEDAVYRERGKAGPGLYGTAEVLTQWAPHLKELAPHIGASVFGQGKGGLGVAEGRRGFVFNELTEGRSVDLVTHAGAGGKILDFVESARSSTPIDPPTTREEEPLMPDSTPNPEDIFAESERRAAEVAALRSEVDLLRRRQLEYDAAEVSNRVFGEARLPAASYNRVSERLVPNAFVGEDGRLDTARFAEAALEAAKDEMGYLSRVRPSGITGMGAGAPPTETSAEAAEAALERELRLSVPNATDAAIEQAIRG